MAAHRLRRLRSRRFDRDR